MDLISELKSVSCIKKLRGMKEDCLMAPLPVWTGIHVLPGFQTQTWNWATCWTGCFLSQMRSYSWSSFSCHTLWRDPRSCGRWWSEECTQVVNGHSSSKLINLSASFFNQRSVFNLLNSLFFMYMQTAEEQVL